MRPPSHALEATPGGPGAQALVEELRAAADPRIRGVLLFGSQLVRTDPGRHSAYDMVVLVDDYRAFYEALVEAGAHGGRPWLLSALARVLPPNVVSFAPRGLDGPVAKCQVLTLAHFERGLSPRARDHFLKGRMIQRVALLHAHSQGARDRIRDALAAARHDVLHWVKPWLESPFTAGQLARRMLEVSYRAEIRPESRDRVDAVFEAQRGYLERTFAEVLVEAEGEGLVERVDGGPTYRFATPATGWERLWSRFYFAVSKARATARWLKHVVTYDDWLAYIVKKVERRTGMSIELTRLERKLPLIFLWPRVIRVLRHRPREAPKGEGDEEASP